MIKRKLLVKIVFIFAAVLIAGCATKGETYKFYSGETRSSTDLATIVPFHETIYLPVRRTDVFLIEIDGKLTESYNQALPSYKILPGEHKIKVGFRLISNEGEVGGVNPEEMVFTAKAGHTYITKANLPKIISSGQTVISFWIEDVETKEVMVGTRPVQAEQYNKRGY